MNTTRLRLSTATLTGLLLAGCAAGPIGDDEAAAPDAASSAGPDGATGTVFVDPFAPQTDPVRVRHALPEATRSAAGAVLDACDPSAVVDLNRAGVTRGNVTRYVGSNRAARATSAVRGSCAASVGAVVAFRYVPRTAAPLRVTTDNAGTAATFDTVAFARGRCSAEGTELGCSDDLGTALVREDASSFTLSAPRSPGDAVYLFVGGFAGARGDFELSVTELELVAEGGTCDPAMATNVCAMAMPCVPVRYRAATGTCARAGGLREACRVSGPACDGALVCKDSRCVPSAAPGERCDIHYPAANSCAPGSSCLYAGAYGSESVCVADGSSGGRCRGAGSPCDGSLACFDGTCRRPIAIGGRCGEYGSDGACIPGASCVYDYGSGGATCTADGASGARCRTSGAACDPSLSCDHRSEGDRGVCLPSVAREGRCDSPRGRRNACVSGTICTDANVCAADGAEGARCRADGLACDLGLSCSGARTSRDSRCIRGVALGGTCDTGYRLDACVEGATCVQASGTATCVADGSEGARCRASDAACDTGLECNGPPTATFSLCRRAVTAGGRCDARNPASGICVAGTSCVNGTCVAEGSPGARCRTTGVACDPGLACAGSQSAGYYACLPSVGVGGACDMYRGRNACVAGAICAGSGELGTCRVDGAKGGRCRETGTACDSGLSCAGSPLDLYSRCLPTVGLGGACDGRYSIGGVCGAGSSCITVGSESRGTCVADGSSGGRCRAVGAACDAALTCAASPTDGSLRCLPSVEVGGRCDWTGSRTNACAEGSTCVYRSTGDATCVAVPVL